MGRIDVAVLVCIAAVDLLQNGLELLAAKLLESSEALQQSLPAFLTHNRFHAHMANNLMGKLDLSVPGVIHGVSYQINLTLIDEAFGDLPGRYLGFDRGRYFRGFDDVDLQAQGIGYTLSGLGNSGLGLGFGEWSGGVYGTVSGEFYIVLDYILVSHYPFSRLL